MQLDGSIESVSGLVLEIDQQGVDWAAVVDETTAEDINREEKAKPKEDETDKAEEADKGKSIGDLSKTLEDSAKDKKSIAKAALEKEAAEKFASAAAGASDASEDIETPNNKLAATIGQALS